MTAPTTKPGTKRLSELARKVVAPRDIVSTGWPAVRNLCEQKLGLTFDDWQHGAGRVILSQRADGKLAAMIDGVGMSLPRQVGKTYLMAAIIFALCILRPGLLVIWSAHHSKTHNETFLSMQAFAERVKIRPYIRRVYTGSGDEEVRFLNGSRILFGARERGFGRGIPGVDILVFDEAQILSDKALANMLATLNVSRFGLALFIGTPPRPEDDSEVFERMRRQAYDGDLHDGAWIEFGAPSGTDPKDRKAYAVANPSYPKRTPLESILRLLRKLRPDDFLREGLGIWDDAKGKTPFPNWPKAIAEMPPASDLAPTSLGVDMSHDRVIAITGCWVDPLLPDDSHLELLSVDVTGDTAAAVEWIVARAGRRIPVVIDGASPAASMIPTLKARKVKVVTTGPGDMGKACGGLHDAVRDGHAWHPKATDDNGQQALGDAMAGCTKRNIGTAGAWGLDRTNPDQNIAPAVSAVLAHFGAAMTKRKRTKTRGVVFS